MCVAVFGWDPSTAHSTLEPLWDLNEVSGTSKPRQLHVQLISDSEIKSIFINSEKNH